MSVLVVSFVVFGIGLYGVLVRRDFVGVLASIEVMIGGSLLLLVSLGSWSAYASPGGGGRVESTALLVMVLAAAEAAIGLALVVAVSRASRTTRVDEITEVRG
jgi:NADH-quinone oxidoreductase subunit K